MRKGAKGQALLEGTLTLLGLLVMITSVLDLGQVFLFMQYFTDRARAGARYASVTEYSPGAIANFVVYNNAAPPTGGGPGLMGLRPENVAVQRYDEGTPSDRIEVSIRNFDLRFYTPLLTGIYKPRPFKAVFPVESLGAVN